MKTDETRPEYVAEAMEMIGIDLDAPKKIIQEVSGFTPLFDAVVREYKDETRAAVHGAMWRFCQMEDGVCKASLETIAELIGVSAATAMRHAEELVKDGYFVDLTPDLKNKPHVYADTGKVVMKSKLSAHISERNVSISQRNVGISESQLSKDINKDSKKKGDLVDGMLHFGKQAQERGEDKVEAVIQELERGLKVNIARTTKNQAVAKRLVRDGRPLSRWLSWLISDEWRASHTYLYADMERVWREFPQAFEDAAKAMNPQGLEIGT